MLDMPKTSPIRRYVLLRHRDLAAASPRWSVERIGSAPRDVSLAGSVAAAQRALGARR